ncbi:MAG TPA: glycosyltransferase family 9 protein, partial [Pirellulales bacterium]|nr:glycosyltransferase family 9 protein [Pirellulales bacterium]
MKAARARKIGIFLPNWIGDTVMATPALRALRGHFGAEARLVGVLRPYLADVLAGTSWLDEQIFYNPRSGNATERSWAIASRLRRERLDALVLLTNSLRTGLVGCASGARQRVGYVRYGRGFTLTTRLYAPRAAGKWIPTPAIDSYLRLAYALGCPTESPRLELATLPADERAADAVWRKLGLPGGDNVVVLNSGGAFGAAKHWPAEYFGALARRIATAD